MNGFGNDRALLVAERLIDYSHEKERQERLRQERYIQHKKEKHHANKKVAVLIGIVVLMLVLCVMIVFLDMQARERENRIAALQTEVMALKKENQEAEKRLSNTSDYKWVREEALKLGMSQVTADRVIYYSVDDADFMEQHENIPTG